eukprot:scaffold5125_cov134-Isochrysis_galbana.AAC.4
MDLEAREPECRWPPRVHSRHAIQGDRHHSDAHRDEDQMPAFGRGRRDHRAAADAGSTDIRKGSCF